LRRFVLLFAAFCASAVSASARSIDSVVAEYGPAARERLRPHFERAHVTYPPQQIWLLAFKAERRVELWAGSGHDRHHIKDYEIQAASGDPGPKLRQGDMQVPEGIYRILWLNPNSSYHLSLKVDYPSAYDREKAHADHRTDLGGDIFIHGRAVSIGCIALGDPGIEELFVLAAEVGVANVHAIIAPHDFRQRPPSKGDHTRPAWLPELYQAIARELTVFPTR
jgi:hypothetical protein